MNNALKIGRRKYQILGTTQSETPKGLPIVYTSLRGTRGAEVTLMEVTNTSGYVSCTLIHFGRMKPAERIEQSWIER